MNLKEKSEEIALRLMDREEEEMEVLYEQIDRECRCVLESCLSTMTMDIIAILEKNDFKVIL